ncbi:hypothetical protein CBR_g401 [Chara braunii]|uniref:Endonuclease/exonuclease/phosphatase domain-containing protein n=1 Tax=Chara braunii TaxID=69332 RepID=A0A388JQK3_CHABU|nr:hypothetical protein CBR_g401 [Chara braunii]|eukprot:GBG60070.1 hypothetical protein CBR_g401 [Chara braunii]
MQLQTIFVTAPKLPLKEKWLKERTVIFIFQEEAKDLTRGVKEDLIRAYEDGWTARRLFNPELRRGRVKFEGPNVVSYVAKAVEGANWLAQKGTITLNLRGKDYTVTLKPWMMKQELKEVKLREAETNFWIVALRVPLEAMYYVASAAEGLIGGVKFMHPPEADRSKPKLVNMKLDMEPQARFRVEDHLLIESPKGGVWKVEVATPFSDWCRNADVLFQAGVRWFKLDGIREQNRHELETLSLAQDVSGLLLLQLNASLPAEKNLQSRFMEDSLVVGWRSPSHSAQSAQSRGSGSRSSRRQSPAQGQRRGSIPVSDNLVITGDWNVSLDEAAREGSHTAGWKDACALLDLMMAKGLSDPYRSLNPDEAGYTWFSNVRKDNGGITRRRLDYFLVGRALQQAVTQVKQLSHPLSDHKPVVADLVTARSEERGRGYFKLNAKDLEDPGLKGWVANHMEAWQTTKGDFGSAAEWLDGGIAIISRVLSVSSRILARERNREEEQCKRSVEEAERRLEQHPISELVWAAEREKRMAAWEKLQIERQARWEENLKVKGIIVQDKLSKENFQRLLPSYCFHQVVQLTHPPPVISPEGILDYARLYYSDILMSRKPREDVLSDLSMELDMWEDTDATLVPAERLSLDRPVSIDELQHTLAVMAAGKCPGRDGLTVEFYRSCWDAVGPALVEVYNKVLTGEKLGDLMTFGVISVMFKKGDKSNIRNYRPISVLNVSYKLLAKTLALRLGRILPKLVEHD